VYLPPGYEAKANAHRRYPVVYLLHGYPGSPIDWFRAAEVQDQMDALLRYHLVQPMLIVAPDASGGWLHDSEMLNQVGGPQVDTYLTHTVVAAVDARYRTIPDRSGRAIGGVSSGGYGALNLGLRHQATYSVILSMMPNGDPGAVTQSLLGGSRKLWLANSPSHYIPTMTVHDPMAIFLTAGSKDPQLPEARLLARLLTKRGQLAMVTEVPGVTHTWHGARADQPATSPPPRSWPSCSPASTTRLATNVRPATLVPTWPVANFFYRFLSQALRRFALPLAVLFLLLHLPLAALVLSDLSGRFAEAGELGASAIRWALGIVAVDLVPLVGLSAFLGRSLQCAVPVYGGRPDLRGRRSPGAASASMSSVAVVRSTGPAAAIPTRPIRRRRRPAPKGSPSVARARAALRGSAVVPPASARARSGCRRRRGAAGSRPVRRRAGYGRRSAWASRAPPSPWPRRSTASGACRGAGPRTSRPG
jgi:enterochelin esterase-like enzyme